MTTRTFARVEYYYQSGEFAKAATEFRTAIRLGRITPTSAGLNGVPLTPVGQLPSNDREPPGDGGAILFPRKCVCGHRQGGGCDSGLYGSDRLDPKFAEVYTKRGRVRLKGGDPSEAVRDFSNAIALAACYAAPYIGRAEAYDRLGRKTAFSDREHASHVSAGNEPKIPAGLDIFGLYMLRGYH